MTGSTLILRAGLLAVLAAGARPGAAVGRQQGCPRDVACMVVDDFQSYAPDSLPRKWSTYQRRDAVYPVTGRLMNRRERFVVVHEADNSYVRATVHDEAHRLLMPVGEDFPWRLEEYPVIAWRWRANVLPEGAREDERRRDDTGAAVYVVFGTDWLGRPRAVKYTYSSSLPVGTVVEKGPLKVLVVASAPETGTGVWVSHERNVVEDYRLLFGNDPPDSPDMLMIWSDSDSTDSLADADFDDIMVLASASR